MKEDDVYLRHILDAIDKIDSYAAVGKEAFMISEAELSGLCANNQNQMGRHSQTKLHHIKPDNRGFTMIELVVVLIVLFIFSTVVLSTYRTDAYKLMAEMDGLKVSLRFAQIQALNDDTVKWGIYFPDSTTYRLYKGNVDASLTMIPVKGSDDDTVTAGCPINCHKLSGNVQIPQSVVGKTINFDKWGRPLDGATLLGADFSIVLDPNDPSKTITITMNTGYIP